MSHIYKDGVHVITQKRNNSELNKHIIDYKNESDKEKTIHFFFPGTNGRYEHPILFHVGKGKNEAVIDPDFKNYAHIIKVKFAAGEERKIDLNVRKDKDNENFDRRYSDFKIGKKKEGFWKKLWRFIKNPCKYCRNKIERERFKKNLELNNIIEEIMLYNHGITLKPDTVSNGDIVQDKNLELLNKLHTIILYNNDKHTKILENIHKILKGVIPRDKSEEVKKITQPSTGGRKKTKK